jgi:hypothetical protein
MRPALSRTLSMHNEEEAWPNSGYFAYVQAPTTPHEPLSLDWTGPEISLPDDVLTTCGQLPSPQEQQPQATEEGTDEDSPGPLEVTPPLNQHEELPPLPPLPPLDMLPTQPVETIFQRSVNPVSTKPPSKKITPTPVPNVSQPAPIVASRKRSTAVASVSTKAPPRKKRRGQRAGTYQCMVNGELYDCPFHYDMVPKSLILSLLTR